MAKRKKHWERLLDEELDEAAEDGIAVVVFVIVALLGCCLATIICG